VLSHTSAHQALDWTQAAIVGLKALEGVCYVTGDESNILTISKYPPYMSGHSFESMQQNRALLERTGRKHHELTYDASVYDRESNFNDDRELMEQCENAAVVHRIGPQEANVKVFDGTLIHAFIGKAITLIEHEGINVISTFYLDPHAPIANRARDYGQDMLGKRIVVAHKAVGSDVLNSIANHYADGQGQLLLMEYLKGDLQLAVSQYTRDELIRHARHLLPQCEAERLEEQTQVLYAPLDNGYFETYDADGVKGLRRMLGIGPSDRVISYFGRVFPEKGIDDLIVAFGMVKEHVPEAVLIVGGQGLDLPRLRQLAEQQGTPDIIFTGGVSDNHKRAIMQMSEVGVIPTVPINTFVETLCISAVEYLAAGTPLITTPIGGVKEAAGEHSMYTEPHHPRELALAIEHVLGDETRRAEMASTGQLHARQFNYRAITDQFLDLVDGALSQPVVSNLSIYSARRSLKGQIDPRPLSLTNRRGLDDTEALDGVVRRRRRRTRDGEVSALLAAEQTSPSLGASWNGQVFQAGGAGQE
jgi:glycosyltransferase involved in cell wall biosynthesis